MKGYRTIIIQAVCLGALTACSSGSVQETLGLDRNAPDEFRVVSRPPLSVPPEFNLRPPGDTTGAAASVLPVHSKAQNLIQNGEGGLYSLPSDSGNTARPVDTAVKVNSAEAQFLKNAGADHADSTVRESLREERVYQQIEQEEESWWGSLWSSEEKEPVIDASGEAERIQTNQEQGKPVNEGEIRESGEDRGIWGRLFGD